LALLDLGSSVDFAAGPCLDRPFLLEPGLEDGVLSDVRGLVSVKACSLPGTGEPGLEAVVLDPFAREPSGEDSISSITKGPCLVVLVFLKTP